MTYYAEIDWKNNTPFHSELNDVYFANASCIEEKNHVFIQLNDLLNRFKNLSNTQLFIIAEIGFGCALNFLLTLKLWQELAPATAKLYFISFEKSPLHPKDIIKILSNFPELTKQTKELIEQYYIPSPATHRLTFSHNVVLNLVIGDVNQSITQQQFTADTWYLDGFSPHKNNTLCNKPLFAEIARLSKIGTTFATFSASLVVRKLLTECGFTTLNKQEYKKREMLYGCYLQQSTAHHKNPTPQHWFDRYHNINQVKKVIIIGGGISGAATAYSLAKRGYKVTLYEKNSKLASEASGNPQGILYGNFAGNYTPIVELSLSGYRYSHCLIKQLLTKDIYYSNCGVIQLSYNNKTQKQHQQLLQANLPPELCYFINQQQMSDIAGIEVNGNSGLFFPYGLWVDPRQLVKILAQHPNIDIKLNTDIETISQVSEFNWQVMDINGNLETAANLVLCNSYSIAKFTQLDTLYLRKIRGQISIIPKQNNLTTILCSKGYMTPNKGNNYIIGASFKFNDTNETIIQEEHLENLDNFRQLTPKIIKGIDIHTIQGKASFRASTTDYVPLVGPVADYSKFKNAYANLSKDSNYWIDTPCPYLKGLFINAAHGAKGILTAPICGEIIADYIDNTPLAISEPLRQGLHPNRFWYKDIIKHR